ncbi:MAG: helix-turn-helix domain-containing protein [Bacillota bacterium]
MDIKKLSGLIGGKYSSQRMAARAMGINHSYLSKVLKGKRKPGKKFIDGMLKAFNDVKYEEIFINK